MTLRESFRRTPIGELRARWNLFDGNTIYVVDFWQNSDTVVRKSVLYG